MNRDQSKLSELEFSSDISVDMILEDFECANSLSPFLPLSFPWQKKKKK